MVALRPLLPCSLFAFLAAACTTRAPFHCGPDAGECASGATCIASTGFCATPTAPTPACPSGLVYDRSAGSLAGTCVVDDAGTAGPEAGREAPPSDARHADAEESDGPRGERPDAVAADGGRPDTPPPSVPRAIAPLSGATATTQMPAFSFVPVTPSSVTQIVVCKDAGCLTVVKTAITCASTIVVSLPPGLYFWQLHDVIGGKPSTLASPSWELRVGDIPAAGDAGGGSPRIATAFGDAPDFDGDGYADLALGGAGDGSVTLLPGAPCASPSSTVMVGPSGASFFGQSVSAVDLNGDGLSDLVVGASGPPSSACATDAAPSAGTVYVYLGTPSGLPASPSETLPAPAGATRFGWSVAGIGDLDGDGYGDVAVGSPGNDTVYIYQGSASGLVATPSKIAVAGGSFGDSVAAAGDVNGDGRADLVVADSGAGAAYLYLLVGATRSAHVHEIVSGLIDASSLGVVTVGGATDVNGDGYADVLVGNARSGGGSVRLFLGQASPPYVGATAAQTLAPPGLGGSGVADYATSLAGVGDVNGDGYGDAVVGDSGHLQDYLYRGSATGLGSVVLLGGPVDVASSVAAAGDVNGDGFLDAVIGGAQAGSLFLGGTTGLTFQQSWSPVDSSGPCGGTSVE